MPFHRMKRRTFMVLLGGAAALGSLAARMSSLLAAPMKRSSDVTLQFRSSSNAEIVTMTTESTAKNLGAVFDAHVKAEFVDKDVAATMATMVAEPYLTHVPTLTGGTGRAEVERFYRDHFVGHWPDDVEVKSVSRTDRKSTRLNSSHLGISYAVFCLKKK